MNKLVKLCALSVCVTALAACGNGSDDDKPSVGTPPPASMAPPPVDGFFGEVLKIVGMSSDATEPISIDTATPTTPDTTDPETIS